MARIAFTKTTPEGLAVEVERYEGVDLLLLTKTLAQSNRIAVQVMGIAMREINSPTITWYYEYEPLPNSFSRTRLDQWLSLRGYTTGTFDQFGNFNPKAA